MALIRHDSREIQFKIVYCGPPKGGKTTNLQYIHRRLDPHLRGDLVSIATEGSRTIQFDYLPIHTMEIAGYRTKFQLYTVPGQEVMQRTRETVLAGADGIVFVADSSPDRFHMNTAAFDETERALRTNQIDPERIPMVFQYNKRDLHRPTNPEDLDDILEVDAPSFLSCATSGYQVFAALDAVTQQVLKGFHASDVTRRSQDQRAARREAVELVELAG